MGAEATLAWGMRSANRGMLHDCTGTAKQFGCREGNILATDPACVTAVRLSCTFWSVGAESLQTYHQMPGEGKKSERNLWNRASVKYFRENKGDKSRKIAILYLPVGCAGFSTQL
jgi:hypothetical protein